MGRHKKNYIPPEEKPINADSLSIKQLLATTENKINFLIGIITVVLAVVLVGYFGIQGTTQASSNTIVVTPSPTPVLFEKWATYKNSVNNYLLKFYPHWKINEKDPNRVTFNEVKEKGTVATISQVIVSIVANPQEGQAFTTQDEFDNLFNQPNATDFNQKISKIGNTTVNGLNVVTLLNKESGNKNWILVNWFRVNDVNFYITVRPKAEFTKNHLDKVLEVNNSIVSSFNFYQPDNSQ